MKLDNFELEYFDNNNFEHKKLLVELNNDHDFFEFMGSVNLFLDYTIKHGKENGIDEFFVVKYNNEVIGLITINLIDDKYEISYAILPQYRHEYLASLLLQEFSEEIFNKYSYVDKIYLQISQKNMGSRKVASIVGFQKEKPTRYYIERGREDIYDKSR